LTKLIGKYKLKRNNGDLIAAYNIHKNGKKIINHHETVYNIKDSILNSKLKENITDTDINIDNSIYKWRKKELDTNSYGFVKNMNLVNSGLNSKEVELAKYFRRVFNIYIYLEKLYIKVMESKIIRGVDHFYSKMFDSKIVLNSKESLLLNHTRFKNTHLPVLITPLGMLNIRLVPYSYIVTNNCLNIMEKAEYGDSCFIFKQDLEGYQFNKNCTIDYLINKKYIVNNKKTWEIIRDYTMINPLPLH